MNGHFTAEQISACAWETDGPAAGHLASCPACRAQAEELRQTLAAFGATVRSQAEREEWHWTRPRARSRERRLTEHPTPRWAWIPAGVMAILLLAVLLLSRAPRMPAPITSDVADNDLLIEVQDDAQREFPSALAPVILINDERNEILSSKVQPAAFPQPEGHSNE